MSDKLSSIDSHPAFFLLKNCLSFPKLVFLLRSAPCFLEREALESFDLSIRSCAGAICNTILDDPGWLQAKLPVSLGGLGLRSVLDISLPAYLSSLAFCRPITQSVLPTHIMTALIDSTRQLKCGLGRTYLPLLKRILQSRRNGTT